MTIKKLSSVMGVQDSLRESKNTDFVQLQVFNTNMHAVLELTLKFKVYRFIGSRCMGLF